MIQLTRLNKTLLAVNSDLIKYVEQAHDTVITLINGEKLVVLENMEEVIERFREFRRSILAASAAYCTATGHNSAVEPQQPAGATSEGLSRG